MTDRSDPTAPVPAPTNDAAPAEPFAREITVRPAGQARDRRTRPTTGDSIALEAITKYNPPD